MGTTSQQAQPLWSAAACRRCRPSRLAGTCFTHVAPANGSGKAIPTATKLAAEFTARFNSDATSAGEASLACNTAAALRLRSGQASRRTPHGAESYAAKIRHPIAISFRARLRPRLYVNAHLRRTRAIPRVRCDLGSLHVPRTPRRPLLRRSSPRARRRRDGIPRHERISPCPGKVPAQSATTSNPQRQRKAPPPAADKNERRKPRRRKTPRSPNSPRRFFPT